LLDGINDSEENARKLAGLLNGIPCKINLIPFKRISGSGSFKRAGRETVERFRGNGAPGTGLDVFVRRSRGQEISAACGRLGGKSVGKEKK